jgi:hypothetical protein
MENSQLRRESYQSENIQLTSHQQMQMIFQKKYQTPIESSLILEVQEGKNGWKIVLEQ